MADPKKNDEKRKIIETQDENGNLVKFEMIDMLELDGNEYVLLLMLDENKKDNSDNAVVMRLKEQGDGYLFERIDNDEEFEKLKDYITKLKKSLLK